MHCQLWVFHKVVWWARWRPVRRDSRTRRRAPSSPARLACTSPDDSERNTAWRPELMSQEELELNKQKKLNKKIKKIEIN